MLESLESRRLFAVTAVQNGAGAVTVDGGNALNSISVVEDNGTVSVFDNTVSGDPIATFTGATAITILGDAKSDDIFFTGNSIGANIFTLSGTDTIVIDDYGTGSSSADGEGDSDSITILRANNTTVIGGGAADQIFIQESVGTGVTWCYGLGGGDTMTTYAGVNHLFGDGGNDTVIVGASFSAGAGHLNIYDNIETILFV